MVEAPCYTLVTRLGEFDFELCFSSIRFYVILVYSCLQLLYLLRLYPGVYLCISYIVYVFSSTYTVVKGFRGTGHLLCTAVCTRENFFMPKIIENLVKKGNHNSYKNRKFFTFIYAQNYPQFQRICLSEPTNK